MDMPYDSMDRLDEDSVSGSWSDAASGQKEALLRSAEDLRDQRSRCTSCPGAHAQAARWKAVAQIHARSMTGIWTTTGIRRMSGTSNACDELVAPGRECCTM